MTNRHSADFPLDLNAPPGHSDAVESEPACGLADRLALVRGRASDRQVIGSRGLPIEQADDRPLSVGSAQLQSLVAVKRDINRLDIHAAIGDLNHGIGGFVRPPTVESISNMPKPFVLAYEVEAEHGGCESVRSYSPPPMSALKAYW